MAFHLKYKELKKEVMITMRERSACLKEEKRKKWTDVIGRNEDEVRKMVGQFWTYDVDEIDDEEF